MTAIGRFRFWVFACAVLLPSGAVAAEPADLLLSNGKIVTVDGRFSIARAVAIKGERIVAVGDAAAVAKWRGPGTRVIDLKGRTVIPGLIDNHAHYVHASAHWDYEVRLDGITSRKEAVERLRARAKVLKPGEWLLVVGGWIEEQFQDSRRPFTREELDDIAPANPAMVTRIFGNLFLNSQALAAYGIDEKAPDPRGGRIVRDAGGKPTGEIVGGAFTMLDSLPKQALEKHIAGARAMSAELNRHGITAFLDASWPTISDIYFEGWRRLVRDGEARARLFYMTYISPETPEAAEQAVARIAALKHFQGDHWIDNVGYGETVYRPLHDNLLAKEAKPRPDQLALWGKIAAALAQNSITMHVHATLTGSINGFLDEVEKVHAVRPIKNLRWTFAHLDQVDGGQLERMKKLGIYAAIHSRPTIQGVLMHNVHGDRAYDMPPLRLIRDSGIRWGLGTDATIVTPVSPFITLGWAVTGRMVGGFKVTNQTIGREDALIAYTRSNAYFLFQESNLGSIEPGKLADLVVLDRDYLTVPAETIKDLRPVMTLVGGKVVFQ